jgi:hypothetical protein
MAPQDVAHGNVIHAMSQMSQGALDAAITPRRVVVGHVQDERFDLIRDTRTPSLPTPLAAVQLMSDELCVPAHQGFGRGESGQGCEACAANRKGEGRETTAFGIGEADASTTEFGMEGVVFFQEIGHDLLLVAMDPTGDHGDEDLQNHSDSWGWE